MNRLALRNKMSKIITFKGRARERERERDLLDREKRGKGSK